MKEPAIRIDLVTVLVAGLSAIVVIGAGSVAAKKYYNHPLAKAWHTIF